MHNPPSIFRAQKKRNEKFQEGTVLSYTIIRTSGKPRCIGLVELKNGTKVLAPLSANSYQLTAIKIGQHVLPRMRLQSIAESGLRVYDVCYEIAAPKPCHPEPGRRAKSLEERIFPSYILALTGPSGVGKSTISRLLVKASAGRLAHVPIITTRAPKKGDENEYIHTSQKEFDRLKRSGEIIACAGLPSASEKRWYGYRAADIEKIWDRGQLPVVITEMHLLQGLAKRFGRRAILSFGLLPPGRSRRAMLSSLFHRLRIRSRELEHQIRERLKNAEYDLAFFKERADLFDYFIVNTDVETVVDTVKKRMPELPA